MNRSYRSYLNRNLLMVNSELMQSEPQPCEWSPLKFVFIVLSRRAGFAVLCLLAACLALPSAAFAQGSFTLQAGSFSPDAVTAGGTSASNITVGAINGFSGTVNLTCAVSPATLTDPPVCLVSPATVTAPGTASATITTKSDTAEVPYSITITGTAPGQTTTTPPQDVTVLAVAPQFTVTIQRAVQPGSVPAGNGAVGIVSINPINGYISPGAGVTLSCNSITPLVTYPPYCSFDKNPVPVNGAAATSSLTINTFGPIIITKGVAPPRIFYALWIPFPMLALVGLGAAVGGKRSRKVWGLLALFVVSGTLLLMPACGNTTTTTTTHNGITPDNTYTFTVIGVDANGVVSSNTGSGNNTNPSVTLTVTTPTN